MADLTTERLEAYRDGLISQGLANRTINKYLVVLHGVFKRAMKVYGLPANPMTLVEKRPNRDRVSIDVFSRDEIMALVRAARDEQDAAIYLTAAFTGLRMGELLALRWRDVDFSLDAIRVKRSFTGGKEDTPKSGRGRTVPMASEVGEALARLSRRAGFTGEDDLVFCGTLGGHVMPSKLRLRFFLNRTNRSGIIQGGIIGGRAQDGPWGMDARWKVDDLTGRIQKIGRFAGRISVSQIDAAEYLESVVPTLSSAFVYLDPPYYTKVVVSTSTSTSTGIMRPSLIWYASFKCLGSSPTMTPRRSMPSTRTSRTADTA